jgi:asparagine synthase (glutamine-hydrolysing)
MGGIAGWVGAGAPAEDGAIAPMLESLAHRGSGEGGAVRMRRGLLGAPGPRPLHDAQAGLAIALDGEIGNRDALRVQLAPRGYRFEGTSSAEVLLRAYQHWDKDVVKQLRGGFAFALWDARKERLLLARDRFGEKPLHLHEANGVLSFASEAKALLEHPRIQARLDLHALAGLLRYGYVPGPRTLFEGVRKLAPGSYAMWQFDRLREVRYWTPPDREPLPQRPLAADPVEAFIAQLDEAVRLRAADGAPGLFLGGGFDSGALLALMARQGVRARTFTAGLPGAPEFAGAARAARHFGAEHHELVLSPAELAAELPRAIAARDAPLARPSELAVHLLSRAAARQVGAVLTGDGGDEIVGGYRRHAAECFAGSFYDLMGDAHRRWTRWGGGLTQPEGLALAPLAPPEPHAGHDADPRASRLRRMLYFEQCGSLTELLERADRIPMAASLEARAPFLDHRFAEHVSALPDALRVRGLSTKWILRQAARRLLPRAAAPRQAGFAIRAGDWLRGELRESLLEHLRGTGSRMRAYFNPPALDRVLDEHLAGRRKHEELLWTLLNLEIWHRKHRIA